ncbi:unnamed protein product [Heligmosomoides polygyrus]|uniref:DoxX family protein n=1 Tax=Heligmosomoides polygyrus TaxID=6339 RepID=A0A183G7V1_HELPZ|nr:unnamed protein product [Heligmosomoides polygyrus]
MVQENVNLSTAKPPHKESHDPRIARFTASVLLLATMGLIQLIGQRLALGGPLFIAQLLFVLLCAFTNEVVFEAAPGVT